MARPAGNPVRIAWSPAPCDSPAVTYSSTQEKVMEELSAVSYQSSAVRAGRRKRGLRALQVHGFVVLAVVAEQGVCAGQTPIRDPDPAASVGCYS